MFITYKNVDIYYTVVGEGFPLVLLHGWGGSSKSMLAFENQLSSERKVINIDFPPFGQSGKLLVAFELVDYVSIVKEILKKENIFFFDVIAHSFGGRVALMLASEGLVDKMILISAAGVRVDKIKTFLSVKWYKFKKFLVKMKLLNSKHVLNAGSEDYKNLDDVMKKTFSNIVCFDEKYLLKRIKSKTLLVWGKQDSSTPVKIAKILNKKIKQSELVLYTGGHFVYIEKFNEIIIVVKYFLRSK